MAIVLSILDEQPAPLENEQPHIFLTLSYRQPSPRERGERVSNGRQDRTESSYWPVGF